MDLYKGDCFDIFPKIKDRSVDLFLLDLPFNQTSVAWDKDIIDLDKMWIEIKRMMKKSGIIVFFCTARFGYRLIHSNPKWFKYDLIYKKGKKAVGFLSANKRQLRAHENIYVFKEEQGTYNPQKTPREKDYKHSGKRSREDHYGNIIDCKKEYKKEDGKHPISIIEDNKDLGMIEGGYYRGKGQKPFKRMPSNKDGIRHPTSIIDNTILDFTPPSKTIHRTQKPVELLEWLIRTYSNEDDVVMDFTMGSGSCGVACCNTNRQFIGIEKDEEIFNLAEERILNHIVDYGD